ncbi:MAG: NADH:flavin oxidoreductase [Gammaproteobacteria bacterium]|nr:NADH:flavin oxidoreductase [Gammaproteobacteria bacterium]
MWKPSQRIKHKIERGVSPDVEKAKNSRWFSPINIGSIELQQRTWVPAMVPWRASEDGFVTKDVIDWYRRFALGKPGVIVVEATGIRDMPSGPLLRIGDDRFIPGLKKLTAAVNEASEGQTRLLIQLIDFLSIRRRPPAEKFFSRHLTITAAHRETLAAQDWSEERIREHLSNIADDDLDDILSERELESLRMGARERVTDMQFEHIQKLPEVLPDLFADAALRAKQSGFDGVELHYAHAYTMASFLSARNDRNDGYGGTRENRVRLPLEVFQRVRERVGDDYTVGCRYLSEECIDGGSELEDALYFGTEFARVGMDFLSLSRGGKFDDAKQPQVGAAAYPYTGPSGYECMPAVISDELGPFGRNIEPCAQIRTSIRAAGFQTPIVAIGGVHEFHQAEAILEKGQADIVGSARQSLADPDWFNKIKSGLGDEVNLCKFTNYCEGLDQKHKQVTCQLWDRKDITDETPLTIDGKRRLIAPLWNHHAGIES